MCTHGKSLLSNIGVIGVSVLFIVLMLIVLAVLGFSKI